MKAGIPAGLTQVLILGISFKENVRDLRNSHAVALVRELEQYGLAVNVYDPIASDAELKKLDLSVVSDPFDCSRKYVVILAVPHDTLSAKPIDACDQLLPGGDRQGILVDLKGSLKDRSTHNDNNLYWTL